MYRHIMLSWVEAGETDKEEEEETSFEGSYWDIGAGSFIKQNDDGEMRYIKKLNFIIKRRRYFRYYI